MLSYLRILYILQATIPFLIAGCGTVCAGLLLDAVQRWQLFARIPEMNVIVTPLLGMKGNLEMTLGSRLSTQVQSRIQHVLEFSRWLTFLLRSIVFHFVSIAVA